jgi:hypothetical protein
MKKLLLIVCALLLSGNSYPPAAVAGENPAKPVSQDIAVTLVPDEHLLHGDSTLVYAVRPGAVELNLDPAAVIVAVSSGGQVVAHIFKNGRLTVATAAAQGPLSLNVRYELKLNDPLPAANAGSEDPSYGINGIISPKGVFLGSSVSWYPRPPAVPLRRTIRISAPAGMEGITSGERLSRETAAGTTRSVWREEPPLGDLALAAGPYLIKERQLPGLLVSTYLYPDNAHLADSYLDAASGYLRTFAGEFGPYPFAKFAVVENFFPTGYGFPSFTLLGSTVIRLPFIKETSLPHEIAHNWWGNGVLVDPDEGNWCEGLVTYLTDYLLEERKGGTAGRDYRLRLLTDFSLLVPAQLDFPLRAFNSRIDPASRAIGYGKGAMLWHMLRRRVGDAAFSAALREVFRARRFRNARWSDFTRTLVNDTGQKLEPYMATWLEKPGGPRLSLADVISRQEQGKWLVTGKVVQTAPFFPLLVPLRLETAAGSFDQTLPLAAAENSFHFVSESQPRRLLLDQDVDIFRLLPASQLPANVNRLKGSTRLLAVTTQGCTVDGSTLRRLLESLGQGSAKIISEEEFGRGVGRDHDLIFCGVPAGAAALLDLPPGIELARQSFAVNNEQFSNPGDLLFLVTRQRPEPKRVSALFLPLSPQAAAGALTKVSHYGNYATLVFTNGTNRHKGRVPQQPAGDQLIFANEALP